MKSLLIMLLITICFHFPWKTTQYQKWISLMTIVRIFWVNKCLKKVRIPWPWIFSSRISKCKNNNLTRAIMKRTYLNLQRNQFLSKNQQEGWSFMIKLFHNGLKTSKPLEKKLYANRKNWTLISSLENLKESSIWITLRFTMLKTWSMKTEEVQLTGKMIKHHQQTVTINHQYEE